MIWIAESKPSSFDQDQGIKILGLFFFFQRCYRKAVVPSRLIHVNPAGFHGRSRSVTRAARNSLQLCAFLTKSARAGKDGECPVKSTLEHLPFQIHNACQKVFDKFDSAPALGFGCFEMKQDASAVGIQDSPRLIRSGRIRGTAIPPAVPGAAILALQSHPRCCHNALRIDFFCLGWSPSCDLFPAGFQALWWLCFSHEPTVISIESLVPRARLEPARGPGPKGF
jgi:hypothetical protein